MKPDLCAPGVSVFSAIPTPYVRETGAEPYDRLDGTSMAAPHVSGTAALLWEAFPEASVTEIKQALYTTALRTGVDLSEHAQRTRVDSTPAGFAKAGANRFAVSLEVNEAALIGRPEQKGGYRASGRDSE